jgi:8-oxo-dGTP pyrophosphatase MutT (NUDIX family)
MLRQARETIMKTPSLPTPYVFIPPTEVVKRLSLPGQYSGHVYVLWRDYVLMLRTIKHNNLFGPGGLINSGETLLHGIQRELEEELPILASPVMKSLMDGKAAGIWRQTRFGVHNTFVVRHDDNSQDPTDESMLHLIMRDYEDVLINERNGLNRPDYLEGDGGLVFVKTNTLLGTIVKYILNKRDDKTPYLMECLTLDGQKEYPIRDKILPAMEEMSNLMELLKVDQELSRAFGDTQHYLKFFISNQWRVLGDNVQYLYCLGCHTQRMSIAEFEGDSNGRGQNLMCPSCAHGHYTALNSLAKFGENWLAMAQQPLQIWNRKVEDSK